MKMNLFERICKTVLLFSVLLNLFHSTDCQDLESLVYKELYQSFRDLSKNESEFNVIQHFFGIHEQIIGFDYQFKNQSNGQKGKGMDKIIEEILFSFIIKSVKKILSVVDIRDIFDGVRRGVSTGVSCLACHSLVSFLFNTRIPIGVLIDVIMTFCATEQIPNISIGVCRGYTNMFKEPLDYIRHNKHLKQTEMCGVLLGVQCYMKSGTCFNNPSIPSTNLCWKLPLSEKKPLIHHKSSSKGDKIYRILHLTDIHLDREYVFSSNRSCGQPYCCRAGLQNQTDTKSDGYWGTYHCDPPLQLVENLFQTINWQSIDLVYWGGDVSSHESWADTRNITTTDSRIISQLLRKYSQSLVVPAIGNHLSIPVGTYAPPDIQNELSSKRIYGELAEEWNQWLDSEALNTFLRAGYYVRKIRPGFRIIVMNTNYCARLNIWTLYQSIDPGDHLKWLIHQLDQAERIGDLVHIFGHIPPDNRECTQSWLYNYMEIVERYSDTIVGQFYGHTHKDEFRFLHSNTNCSKPIGYEILSPSVTPFDQQYILNPAYRVISTTDRGQIIDMETFSFDLSAANAVKGSQPNWEREYSMTTDYSIRFGVKDFNQLLEKIIRDNYYLQLFYSYYTRSNQNDYCNTDCKTIIINDMNICNAFDSIPKSITSIG